MAGDPLYDPLGAAPPPSESSRRWPVLPVGVAALVVVVTAGWWMSHRASRSDQSVAIARIEVAPALPAATASTSPAPGNPPAAPASTAAAVPTPPPAANGSTVEVQNGVKIIRFNPAASSASVMVPVDGAASGPLAMAPDPRVSEPVATGVLPRIGADGSRPADVYARPASAGSGPRLAVLLTGMGADQMATADAARRLAPDFDFAFSDHVADAAAQVAEARHAGHEVYLDLADATGAGQGATPPPSLHARMTRFAGYAGVATTADTPATTLQDLLARGLAVLGSAGGPAETPIPDLVIDASKGGSAIAGQLDGALAKAKATGRATVVVLHSTSALDSLGALPAMAAARGVALVPMSELIGRKIVSGKSAL